MNRWRNYFLSVVVIVVASIFLSGDFGSGGFPDDTDTNLSPCCSTDVRDFFRKIRKLQVLQIADQVGEIDEFLSHEDQRALEHISTAITVECLKPCLASFHLGKGLVDHLIAEKVVEKTEKENRLQRHVAYAAAYIAGGFAIGCTIISIMFNAIQNSIQSKNIDLLVETLRREKA